MSEQSRTTVLVVEDETLVRMHGLDVLEGAGFTVLEAANADEALTVLASHSEVRVLFSDIDMPGRINGLELARIVHDRWPKIRLLLTSGHHRLPDSDLPDDGKFVGKPWSANVLIDTIQSSLSRR